MVVLSSPRPDNGKGGCKMLCGFIVSVVAGVVAYYICKWLDRDSGGN